MKEKEESYNRGLVTRIRGQCVLMCRYCVTCI